MNTRAPSPVPLLLAVGLCLILSATARAQAGTPPGASSVIPETGTRPVSRDATALGPTTNHFNGTSAPRLSLLPVFFPAIPPILDAELPPAPAVRDKIWTELAAETNELFYAPLGTRLSEGDLNRRLRQRLDAYRIARTAALAELRSQLASASSLSADPSGGTESRLTALATTADELRRDLYRGGLLSGSSDWNLHRNWQLGQEVPKRTPQELLYDEFSVLRAAVYFQEGLSINQRQLLREVVIELAAALGEREASAFTDSFEPEQVVFFLPHTARFRVPAAVPEPLAAEIAAFTAAKSALKRELREALFALDRESTGKRERALAELAAKQAPQFAALEPLAERIRAGLAAVPADVRTTGAAGLPSELAARMTRYLREKAEVQRAAQQQTQASSEHPDKTLSPAESRTQLAEFEARNRARLGALATEARAIRDELARLTSTSGTGPKSVDALLADFMTAFKQQQLQSLYGDYRTAVLTPGLAPSQRQLLFDAALAALDLTGTKDTQAVPD